MRLFALLVVISLANCTIVGGVVGGISASNHNSSQPPARPSQPALYEAPACTEHRRELEAVAQQETDPERRALALHALPNCMVVNPNPPQPETFKERDVGLWVIGGAAIGLVIDFSLLVLRAQTLSE